MENYFHHFKAILAGIMIALLITSANYLLGMLIHLITDRGQRDFFSTGSMIIFYSHFYQQLCVYAARI